MAFADTLKITPRDVAGHLYAGKSLRASDVISIDPRIPRLIFRQKVDVKALNFASSTEVVFMQSSKVVHMMAAGRIISLGNLFCGFIEAGHDIIVKGDLTTWIGGIETQNGDICVSGHLKSAAHIRALSGCVIVHGETEAAAYPEALAFWEKGGSMPVTDQIRAAAAAAVTHLKKHMTT